MPCRDVDLTRMHVLTTNANDDTGLSAAASLARAGFKVSTTDADEARLGVKSRFAEKHHVLAGATTDEQAASLIRLVERIRPDAFLPVGMRATREAVTCRAQLSATTAVNVPDRHSFDIADEKTASMTMLEALGVPCARVYSRTEATNALSGNPSLSFVVKPNANIGSAHGVMYVKTLLELDQAISACKSSYGDAVIQEYVPGDATEMRTALLLYSQKSRLVAAFTTRKRRQWPPSGGLTVVSQSTNDAAIVEQVRPFFEHLQWRGPAEVELKRDCITGVHKVIEINPRFPAYLRFPILCGLDLPTMAVRAALDPEIGALDYPAYRTGVTYMNPRLLMKSAAWHVRHKRFGELTTIAADFFTGFHSAVDMLRDPLPMFARFLQRD